MKAALFAGTTFAGCVGVGFALGLWLANRTARPILVVVGLGLGVVIGGYAAMRSLLEAGK